MLSARVNLGETGAAPCVSTSSPPTCVLLQGSDSLLRDSSSVFKCLSNHNICPARQGMCPPCLGLSLQGLKPDKQILRKYLMYGRMRQDCMFSMPMVYCEGRKSGNVPNETVVIRVTLEVSLEMGVRRHAEGRFSY